MRRYVNLYRDDDRLAIRTNATTEEEFVQLAAERFSTLVAENAFGEDWEFAFKNWLPQVVGIVNKLRGYKAPEVEEEHVLTVGRLSPKDEQIIATGASA